MANGVDIGIDVIKAIELATELLRVGGQIAAMARTATAEGRNITDEEWAIVSGKTDVDLGKFAAAIEAQGGTVDG